jgi:rfaE bifunctional protein kinase chain/domain
MNKNIAVFGDLILDKYIIGSTYRISPEAPVPIVKAEEEKYTLGGAANVAHNLVNLGCDVTLLGAIGDDREGQILNEMCLAKNIDLYSFKTKEICTTTKTRILSRNQQMLRIDSESNFNHTPKSIEYFIKSFEKFDIIVASDYAKGFCSDDFFELLFSTKKENSKIIVDPKGRDWKKYNGSYIVKPNLSELQDMIGSTVKNNDNDVEKYGKIIYEKFNFEHLIITRGNRGMTLINSNCTKHFETKNVDVFDVSGAGDTSMAVIAMSIAENKKIETAITLANAASTFVVTKAMTYAINQKELDDLCQ